MLTQNQLDTLMMDEGKARFHANIAAAKAREEESATPYGQRLLSGAIVPFADAIRAWCAEAAAKRAQRRAKAYEPIAALRPETVAFLATRVVLDGIGLTTPYARVCALVGGALEDELRFRWLEKNHPGLFRKLERQLGRCHSYDHKRTVIVYAMNKAGISARAEVAGQDVFVAWPDALRVKVGAVLVDILEKSTQLVELVPLRRGRRLENCLQATAKTIEWIRGFTDYAELLDPVWLPMVEPPAPWSAPTGGGYKGDTLPSLPLVKRASADYLGAVLPAHPMPEVYAAINALQNTAWRINPRVYEVMRALWDNGRSVGGLPQSEDDPLPPKPVDIETNEEARRAWRRKAAATHLGNAALRSVRVQAFKLMNLAQKFAKVEKFYFPYQLDFRGRLYTIPTFLTPQGSDLSRSLLLFADGCPILDANGAYWLGVYGANLFGKDKVTFEERLAWVESQRENILAVAADPLACQWWQEADEPWQFLAWCFEWAGWLQQGPGFVTHFPVCLDGTNNGLQILSMLTRDELAARATNVTPSPSPADIYGEVAKRVVQLMQSESKAEAKPTADFWLSVGVDRKTTKRPVMVLPYGGTFHSCKEYVGDWFREVAKARGLELPDFKEAATRNTYLARRIWDGIEFCVGRPREAMAWLQACANVFSDHNLPIRWTAPSGFPVVQDYKEVRAYTVETTLGDKVRYIDLRADHPSKLSRARQKNGISPNYVHSLDAAALVKTVASCATNFGLTSFAMIHDSYGTHAPRVHELAAALRHAFVTIFSDDQLQKLRDELQAQLVASGVKDEDGNTPVLPEVPAKGSLDVRELYDSEFFFA